MRDFEFKVLSYVCASLKQGLIFVDENKKIIEYSDLAKEIMGITLPNVKSHKPGKIEKDDIVIFMDRELGNDDMMTPGDLSYIGMNDNEVKLGDTVLSIGVYQNPKIKPIYKIFRDSIPNRTIVLNQKYLGFNIECTLDLENRKMSAVVNDEEFYMHYIDNIGFLVVIDGENGEIKFVQAKGYSYRKEDAGLLFRGENFMGKNLPGEIIEFLPTIGMSSKDILDGQEFLRDLDEVLSEEDGTIIEGTYDIYRRKVYCHLLRSCGLDKPNGVFVLVQDRELASESITLSDKFISNVEMAGKNKQIVSYDKESSEKFIGYIGNAPIIKAVKELAYKASQTRFNVIITGESGTGKSKLAKYIHDAFDSNKPFVEVQCNAIAPSLFESELFGYTKGSFTGADKEGKIGFFEEANGGTIFLDEIGDIPYDMQIKLLNVIQNKRIYRVGSTKPIDIDVRIITATNKDLEKEVREGRFRQDLYYRINVFPINIPPLREHKRDLYVLANSILNQFCEKYGVEQKQFSEDAIETISNYDWPGNIRELENIIERAITVCDGKLIYSEHLMIKRNAIGENTLSNRLEMEEKRMIEDSLFMNNNDYKKCMEQLGLSKSVFYERLKKYNIS